MNIEKLLIKKVTRCNKKNSLFLPDEKLAVALSGGKDSMVLLRILSKLHPLSLLYPIHIYPYKDEKILSALHEYSAVTLGIPNLLITEENPLYDTGKKKCYECARGRRKRIFELAEEMQIKKVSMGHTKNDVAETFLMNILYSGNIDTIKPKQDFFEGTFQVIRPLYTADNKETERYCRIYGIMVQNYECSGKANNKREVIRDFLKSFKDDAFINRVFLSALKSNDPEQIPPVH